MAMNRLLEQQPHQQQGGSNDTLRLVYSSRWSKERERESKEQEKKPRKRQERNVNSTREQAKVHTLRDSERELEQSNRVPFAFSCALFFSSLFAYSVLCLLHVSRWLSCCGISLCSVTVIKLTRHNLS